MGMETDYKIGNGVNRYCVRVSCFNNIDDIEHVVWCDSCWYKTPC